MTEEEKLDDERVRKQRGQYAPEGETCLNCKFWAQEPSWFRGMSEGKSCRRYPPVGPFVLTRAMREDHMDNHVFLFPPTYADAWCGEFKPKAERPKS
jgi:hypothetical protein